MIRATFYTTVNCCKAGLAELYVYDPPGLDLFEYKAADLYREGKTDWRDKTYVQTISCEMKWISLFDQFYWKGIARTNFPNKTIFCRPYYAGVKEELSDIKPFLKKYTGGSVDLEKKENGICHVILNQPERGNALSGKIINFS